MNQLFNALNSIGLDDIIFYLTSSEFQKILLPFQIVSLIISTVLLGIIIFTISRTHYFQWLVYQDWMHFVSMGSIGAKKLTKQWNKVTGRLNTASEAEYKLAIIEAEDMLSDSLKKMGYDGQTLEEKLGKLTSVTLPNVQQVHEIHRLRNNIVHDPDYRLSLDEAKRALDVYNQAFRDLQILAE